MKQSCHFHSPICIRDFQIFKEFTRLVLICQANHVHEEKDESIRERVLACQADHTEETGDSLNREKRFSGAQAVLLCDLQ
jgi:hypothetical protein